MVFLAFTPLGASNKAVKQGTLVVWLPNQSISSTSQKKRGGKKKNLACKNESFQCLLITKTLMEKKMEKAD